MGALTEFLSGTPGYFREGCEEEFPWDNTGKTVWYALLNVEGTEVQRYGFTSAVSQKRELIKALKKVKNKGKAILLGVWTGNFSTHLFILNKEKAIELLGKAVGEA